MVEDTVNSSTKIKRWRNGSLGFAEGSAGAVGAKPNVPFVRLSKNFKIF